MAKDPAVLFYYSDFLVGTQFMSNEEKGIYITILANLADKGKLSEKHILNICNSYQIPFSIKEKLKVDEDGLFYNQRMLEEKQKRLKYSESRRNNRLSKKDMNNISKSYDKHMEDVNIDINEINSFVLNEEEMKQLWISTWGRNPRIPEQEITEELIKKFGLKKTHDIFKRATLDGFFKLKTLVESLDENGNIKPKENNGNNQRPVKRSPNYVTKEEYESEIKSLYETRT